MAHVNTKQSHVVAVDCFKYIEFIEKAFSSLQRIVELSEDKDKYQLMVNLADYQIQKHNYTKGIAVLEDAFEYASNITQRKAIKSKMEAAIADSWNQEKSSPGIEFDKTIELNESLLEEFQKVIDGLKVQNKK